MDSPGSYLYRLVVIFARLFYFISPNFVESIVQYIGAGTISRFKVPPSSTGSFEMTNLTLNISRTEIELMDSLPKLLAVYNYI